MHFAFGQNLISVFLPLSDCTLMEFIPCTLPWHPTIGLGITLLLCLSQTHTASVVIGRKEELHGGKAAVDVTGIRLWHHSSELGGERRERDDIFGKQEAGENYLTLEVSGFYHFKVIKENMETASFYIFPCPYLSLIIFPPSLTSSLNNWII